MARHTLTFENHPLTGLPPMDLMVVHGDVLHRTPAGEKLGSDLAPGDSFWHSNGWLVIATTTPEA